MDNQVTTPDSIYQDLSLESLFNGKPYLLLHEQLLYKKEGRYVMTNISDHQNYTEKHYRQLPEGAPYQLINEKLVYMASPKVIHQEVAFNVSVILRQYVKKHQLGKVLIAPMDVYFDKSNVYQPDVLFVSKERKAIIQDWVMGAPDLVVEVLSKSTATIDRTDKKVTYGKYNVLEYWLVDTDAQTVTIYVNEGGEMKEHQVAGVKDTLQSQMWKGLEVKVEEVFV